MNIKKEADRARKRIRAKQAEVEIEVARLRVVQSQCDHPNKFQYSCMGELGEKCPDCGWAT